MFRWITIILALMGFSLAVWTVATTNTELPAPPPDQPPSVNPFPNGIAGTGIVEASSRNIEIASPEPGVVTKVFVEVNAKPTAGDALFEIDGRLLDAELLNAQAQETRAEAELARWQAKPRPEDLPVMEATVAQARAVYDDRKDDFDQVSKAKAASAASVYEVQRKRFAAAAAEADLQEAEAELKKMKAGAWEHDLAVARADLAAAKARTASLKLRRERLIVRSPIDATVIKRDVEPGEMTGAAGGSPPMVVGDLSTLHVRAQIDEEDAGLLRDGAQGKARVRGRTSTLLPLEMVRIEPLAMPKRQVTAVSTELIDTRVIEVVFRITGTEGVSLYPGQLVDVYVDVSREP